MTVPAKITAPRRICAIPINLKEEKMKCRQEGDVLTEITLINTMDECFAREGRIEEHEVRQKTVQAFAGKGRWGIVINEETREKLGLEITSYEDGTQMDGTKDLYKIAGPLEIWWKNRCFCCCALLLIRIITTAAGTLFGVMVTIFEEK